MNPYAKVEEYYTVDGEKKVRLKIVPDCGVWLTFEIDEAGRIYVSMDISRRIPYDLMLNLFEEKNENDYVSFFKYLMPNEVLNVEKGKEKFQKIFFDKNKYKLSPSVRKELNHILYGDEKKINSNQLTKEDIRSIGQYLEKEKSKIEKRKESIQEIFNSNVVEKEIESLEKEIDSLLERLYKEKCEIQKKEIIQKLKENRKRFEFLNR